MIQSMGAITNVTYLPLFCDTSKYHVIQNCSIDIDIVFVGAWYGDSYQLRRDVLAEISRIAKKNGLVFRVYGGGGWSNFPRFIRDFIFSSGFRSNVRLGNLSHKQINDLYNRSSVSINISADNQQTGVPIRVFEVPAAGCRLITNNSEGLRKLENIPYQYYEKISELEALITNELKGDTMLNKDLWGRKYSKEHSLESRLIEILKVIP